ncbi:MAG: type VI secretion system baseplate subunit TssK [Proteobacteria bacterium]|nr:type VI secretion system baseplate subunit TssK [Pseudomonadota bacterium]
MAQLNTNPIQWYEGMLLMPQHFQQADIRTESMMTYYMSHTFSFFWGVVQLKVNESLLTSGIFRPIELEVIMPDGLLVTSLPQTDPPLQVNLLPFREKMETTPHFIYLCVPYRRGDWTDVSGDLPRYHSIVNANVPDINTGEQAIDIPRLIPNLSLQVGLEPPAHYVSLPLAQVTCNEKSFSLAAYIPPQIQVDLLSDLGQACDQLVQQLRGKLAYLQQKVQSVGDRVTKDPFFEEMEQVRLKLVIGLLPFEAILSTGKAHPFDIYQALCTLAAQISGVKYGEIPPRFKGYDHVDLKQSFSQLINYIGKVLDEIEESYSVIPFTLNERVFTLQLQSAWVGDRFVLGARVQPGMTEEALLNWVNNCVIVTDKNITLAKDNRVLGAQRKIVAEVSEMNLVPTKGVQLFVVEADARYIDPKGILCLFNVSDDDFNRPAEVVLYNSNQSNLTN